MSGFLLDTNIPSELMRSIPDRRVKEWVYAQESASLYVSAVTIGELRKGFAILPESKRRRHLEEWFENHLIPLFAGRILPVTQSVADSWGVLDGMRQLSGRPLNTADGMIAATALVHGLTLVTRNVRDYDDLGVTIVNPWEST
jgi:predicted nucleic acid-binding protein